MYSIFKNNYICLTRGDTFIAPLCINQGTKMYPIRYNLKNHPNTQIYLGITEPNQIFEEAAVKKSYTSTSPEVNENGDLVITLKSTDTEYLLPGKYYYEIKLRLYNGDVCTIVPKTEFLLLE